MFIWTITDLLKYGFITIILIVVAFVFLVLKRDDYRQKKLKKKLADRLSEEQRNV
jgi:preprotein translocase subunit YajC